MKSHPVLTVDVAHPPKPPDAVEEVLLEAFNRVRNTPSLRVLKVIHGYGSRGAAGTTRTVVRNWAYRRRGSVRAVIEGETYSLVDGSTQELRKEAGTFEDPDLDRCNPGITVVWVR